MQGGRCLLLSAIPPRMLCSWRCFATIRQRFRCCTSAVGVQRSWHHCSTAAASALLGITLTSAPTVSRASPSPPPSPAPPLACNDVCNWSALKKEPLLSQQNLCAKYQPTSINAPHNPPSVAGEFDLYHCKQAEPGDHCPGDYQMCYGNSYYAAAPTAGSQACPESRAGICGTCPNQDKCGKQASCLKKQQKGKCHKKKVQKKCGRTCAAERMQRAVEKERKQQEKAARKAAKQAAKQAAQQGRRHATTNQTKGGGSSGRRGVVLASGPCERGVCLCVLCVHARVRFCGDRVLF